jgi:hypothetical protein
MSIDHMTVREVRQIQSAYDFWKSFEYDNWVLISFTDTTQARFGWTDKGQYTKYVTVRDTEARFLLGVDVDIIDQFMLSDNHIGD